MLLMDDLDYDFQGQTAGQVNSELWVGPGWCITQKGTPFLGGLGHADWAIGISLLGDHEVFAPPSFRDRDCRRGRRMLLMIY